MSKKTKNIKKKKKSLGCKIPFFCFSVTITLNIKKKIMGSVPFLLS